MLYEVAYPGLWVMARAKHLHSRAMVAVGRKPPVALLADASPDTHFRVVGWKIRKFEIEFLATRLPRRAAALAVERFEVTKRQKAKKSAVETMAGMRLASGKYFRRRVDIRSKGPTAGPKLLFVHGWNASGAGLAALFEPLAEAGFNVYAPDLPGHGSSEGNRYAFHDLGRALALTCNEHGPFEAVIGHSAGGLIAGLAIQHGLAAKRLVTLCAPKSLDVLLETYLLTNQLPHHLLADVRRHYQRHYGAPPADVGAPMFAGLDVDVLAAQDEGDWMIAKTNAIEIAEAATRGSVFFTKGYSHLSILRSSELHEKLLQFFAMPTAKGGLAHAACP